MNEEKTCTERVADSFNNRMDDIRELWKLDQTDPDAEHPELGRFNDYGLSWEYVPAGTFCDQTIGFFRWLLSWGGPSEAFRFYTDPDYNIARIEFWFLDWNDGAYVDCTDDSTLRDIWDMLRDCEYPQAWRNVAAE